MNTARRNVLQLGAAIAGGGWFASRDALAVGNDGPAFDAVSVRDALAAIGGTPAAGSQIALSMPDLVENGAVVPVSVDSGLPGTSEIFIVVEVNPNPMVVRFTIPDGTEPFVSTRIKLAASSTVFAVVRAKGKLYSASRRANVTVGGCG